MNWDEVRRRRQERDWEFEMNELQIRRRERREERRDEIIWCLASLVLASLIAVFLSVAV